MAAMEAITAAAAMSTMVPHTDDIVTSKAAKDITAAEVKIQECFDTYKVPSAYSVHALRLITL